MGYRTEIADLVKKIQDKRGRPLIVMATGTNHPAINKECVKSLERNMDDIPCRKGVDIILNSTGGDAHAAYRIARALQNRCGDLCIFVPKAANSAATLMCLAASQIRMGPLAELGPLDPQMVDPRNPHKRWSTLDGQNALYAAEAALTRFYNVAFETIREQADGAVDVHTALEHATALATAYQQLLLKDVDIIELGRMHSPLRLLVNYGTNLLTAAEVLVDQQIEETMHILVYEYPDHEYIIDAHEARFALGLPAVEGVDEVDKHAAMVVERLKDGPCFEVFGVPKAVGKRAGGSSRK